MTSTSQFSSIRRPGALQPLAAEPEGLVATVRLSRFTGQAFRSGDTDTRSSRPAARDRAIILFIVACPLNPRQPGSPSGASSDTLVRTHMLPEDQ